MDHYYRTPLRAPHRGRQKKNAWLWLAVIVLILGALFFWYRDSRYRYLIETPADPADDAKISFSIRKGATVSEIGEGLMEKELILDEGAFRDYLRAGGLDRNIVAGRFMLQKTQTIKDIAAVITDSKQSEFIVTVPEGSTVRDIDAKLAGMDVIKAGDFIAAVKGFTAYDKYPFIDAEKAKTLEYPLEGYLFPDTYFIDPQNFYSENLVQLMLDNFKNKLGDNLDKQHHRGLADIVIMASIVEKEVRTDGDRAMVAGILWKRLDGNWMLGADATLLYLKNDREIDYKDLQADSPYNTRNRTGLPPGPICNPGLKSILAAMEPEESPYFFYLTKPETGEVVYAVSNDEHNANKVKYL
jgi:UPF0755 protein